MFPLPSGNDILSRSYHFPVVESSQFGEARRFSQKLAERLGLNEIHQGRVAIVINELGNNLAKYARNGELILRAFQSSTTSGIEILSIDSGPGIANIDQSLSDGYSTGSTPGTGLGAIRRQSDFFDIYSGAGKGTVLSSIITENGLLPKIQIGAIGRPFPGESVSGDSWSYLEKDGHIRIIVADGLGHGLQAHKASQQAVQVFQELSQMSLDQLLSSLHNSLKSTRGAAVFLVEMLDKELLSCGVGNVRCLKVDPDKTRTLISQNGTAGVQIRAPRLAQEAILANTILVLHTDGLTTKLGLADYPGLFRKHPSIIAGVLYRDFSRTTDDSTVVVVKRCE